eukprot:6115115-Prymnesium_polylepis.1
MTAKPTPIMSVIFLAGVAAGARITQYARVWSCGQIARGTPAFSGRSACVKNLNRANAAP